MFCLSLSTTSINIVVKDQDISKSYSNMSLTLKKVHLVILLRYFQNTAKSVCLLNRNKNINPILVGNLYAPCPPPQAAFRLC